VVAGLGLIGGVVLLIEGGQYGLSSRSGVGPRTFPAAAGFLLTPSSVLWLASLTRRAPPGGGRIGIRTRVWAGTQQPHPDDPAVRGAALGLRLTSNRALQITVPIAVGAAAGPIGSDAIFWTSAVLLAGATAVLVTAGTTLDSEKPSAAVNE